MTWQPGDRAWFVVASVRPSADYVRVDGVTGVIPLAVLHPMPAATAPALTWRKDSMGHENQALYIGGIYAGYITEDGTLEAPWSIYMQVARCPEYLGLHSSADAARDALLEAVKKELGYE